MANLFFNLPATAGNGSGAAVDVSAFGGPEKTITVQNAFRGAVNIEVSLDGGTTWATVATFNATGKKVLSFAADRMRVTRSGVPDIAPGLPDIDVSSNDNGQRFVALPATAGDGSGAAVDVSTLGTFNSVSIAGTYRGNVNIEISEDGTTWATCFSFQDGGGFRSKDFTAQFMRVTRSGVPEIAPGLPVVNVGAVNDPASAAGGGGGGGCLIFRPGSAFTGPTVFNAWADLITKLGNLRTDANSSGCYTIQFDNSVTSPAVVPAGAYDMTNVTWEGIDSATNVQIADGATFTGLRSFRKNLLIDNLATATVPVTDLADGDIISIHDAVDISTSVAGLPFFRATGVGAGQSVTIILDEDSTLGLTSIVGPVFDLPTFTSTLFLRLGVNSGPKNSTITGIAGTFVTPIYLSSSADFGLQAGFLGTLSTPVSEAFVRYNVNPSAPNPPLTSPSALVHDQLVRADVSGGVFTLTLPAAAGTTQLTHGSRICIAEVSGTAGLLVDGSGADTIDGGTAPIPVPAGGSVVLVSDGVSNWISQTVNASPTTFVFRPGGTRQENIFPVWADLITAMSGIQGPKILEFDSSIVSPAVIPAGGPYPMRGVTWEGGDQGGGAFAQITEGATFTGLRNIRKNLFITNAVTATVPNTDLANGDIITLHDGCDIATTGSVPFWDTSGLAAGNSIILFIDTVSTFGLFASGPVLDMTIAGTFLIGFYGEGGGPNNGTLTGIAGSTHIPSYASPGAAVGLQAGFLGTTSTPFSFAQTRYNINPQPPTAALTAPASISHDQLVRADVSGGGFTLTLPPAVGTFALQHGTRICIKEVSGTAGLLVDGAGADTIDGNAAPVAIQAGGAIVLVSDGVSNWIIQSATPASSPFSPPEKWGLSPVGALEVGTDLAALVSTNFDTIKMTRSGSIVGLSTRFLAAITDPAAGSAVVTVTKNAVLGTLSVSHSSGTNPSGGEATQAPGIDTYVAGDLIGIRVSTLATFAPDTNLEAWLQLAEEI